MDSSDKSKRKKSFEGGLDDPQNKSGFDVPDHEKDINDELTIENMFRVFDKEAGAMVDIREIMDFTEEDFKENPELLNIIKQMNETNPVSNPATKTKYEETEMSMSNPTYYISHSK